MGEVSKDDIINVTVVSGLGMVTGYFGGFAAKMDKLKYQMSPIEATCRGGARLGLSTLCFHGVRNYLVQRHRFDDAYATVAAACASGAAFGLTNKGPPLERVKIMAFCIAGGVPCSILMYNWAGKLAAAS